MAVELSWALWSRLQLNNWCRFETFLAIWQHNKRVLGVFFTAHVQKRLFTSF